MILDFPFSDLRGAKRRPALVVAGPFGADLVVCAIATHRRGDLGAIPLEAGDLEQGCLSRASFIRPARIFTADTSLVRGTAGRLRPGKLEEVRSSLGRILGLVAPGEA